MQAHGSASAPAFAFDVDPDTGMYRTGANALAFTTGGTGRLFIDSSGNVGIGGHLGVSNCFMLKAATPLYQKFNHLPHFI